MLPKVSQPLYIFHRALFKDTIGEEKRKEVQKWFKPTWDIHYDTLQPLWECITQRFGIFTQETDEFSSPPPDWITTAKNMKENLVGFLSYSSRSCWKIPPFCKASFFQSSTFSRIITLQTTNTARCVVLSVQPTMSHRRALQSTFSGVVFLERK